MRRLGLHILLALVVTLPATALAQLGESSDADDANTPPSSTETDGKDAGEDLEDYAPITESPELRTVCHGKTVGDIQVEGSRRVDAADIRATMRLRPGLPCTDTEVSRDARAIWDLGFFDDLAIEADVSGDTVDLTIVVKERPAIAKIAYDGVDALDEEDLQEKLSLREGGILSLADIQKNADRLKKLYTEKGYFLARVTYELKQLKNDNNEVEVRFKVEEGTKVVIRQIRFVGNHEIEDSELLQIMQSAPTGVLSFLSSNDTYDPEKLEEDALRLQAYYYDKGYLAMQTTSPQLALSPDRRFIDVMIPIDEGPRFRVRTLTVRELDASGKEVELLGGRELIEKKIPQRVGEYFNRGEIGKGLQDITHHYQDEGYARVEVRPDWQLDEKKRLVDLAVTIRRGPQVYIERINILGNSKTRDRVIRREILLNEGELYSYSKIARSKADITQLGFFERVEVSEEKGSKPDTIVLNFEVVERSTGTFQVGVGYSTYETLIVTGQVQQQNLFGNGQSLSLQAHISGLQQQAQLGLTEPSLFGTDWSASIEAFKTINTFDQFLRDSTGGGLTIGYPLFDDRLRLAAGYRGELVDIRARTGGILSAAAAGDALNRIVVLPLANLFRDGFTSALRLSVTWDSRDNRIFPTAGFFAAYSVEFADEVIGSQNVFLRQTAFARYYQKLVGPLVLKINTEVGLVTSRMPEGVPIFERFRLGGVYDVRGFEAYQLGPHVGLPQTIDPNAAVSANGLPIGGNLKAFYQVEVEFPIVEMMGIKGVVFTDGGNVWNLEDTLCQAPKPSVLDPATNACGFHPNIRASWGFGLRWFSPLGPLRFEWGLPFDRRPHEEAIKFEFAIGNAF